jgi:hypothetical protein
MKTIRKVPDLQGCAPRESQERIATATPPRRKMWPVRKVGPAVL